MQNTSKSSFKYCQPLIQHAVSASPSLYNPEIQKNSNKNDDRSPKHARQDIME